MQLLKLKWVTILLFIGISKYCYSSEQFITLESSTLFEFSQVVSSIISRPIIVTADLDKPFSIDASFINDSQLLEFLELSVISFGLDFNDDNRAIIISPNGLEKLSQIETKIYPLKRIPSNQALKIIKSLLNVSSQANNTATNRTNSNNQKTRYISKNSLNNRSTNNLRDSNFDTSVVVESPNTNSLIITTSKKQHQNLAYLIQSIDVAKRQVLIEAIISEVSDKDFEGLDTKMQYFSQLDSISSDLQAFHPGLGFSLKLINSKSLRFFLDYLETTDESKILSKPKIVTMDRQKARFVVGQNVPFITGRTTSESSDTQNPFQTIQRVEIGLKLNVTPVITPSGMIELTIYQESSSVNNDTTASDIVTNIRSFDSKVLLHDGQSILLGGLSSKITENGSAGSIPFISQIPVLGTLFSSSTLSDTNINLMVMITAKIIDEAGRVLSHSQRELTHAQLNEIQIDVPVTHHK